MTDMTPPPEALIDARIAELADWRGAMLARVREVIRQANPGVVEEWKCNVPVRSHGGILGQEARPPRLIRPGKTGDVPLF